jgi:DNA primase
MVPYQNFKYTDHVYNIHATEMGAPVVLVEGAFDVWKLWQWKIPFTAIATMTSHISEQQVADILAKHSEIYILFDNDEAGWKGTKQAAQLLTRSGGKVDVLFLPDGMADVKMLGRRGFLRAFQKRKSYPCVLPHEENTFNERRIYTR